MDQKTIDALLTCMNDNLCTGNPFLGGQDTRVSFYPLIDTIAELAGVDPDVIGDRFNEIRIARIP